MSSAKRCSLIGATIFEHLFLAIFENDTSNAPDSGRRGLWSEDLGAQQRMERRSWPLGVSGIVSRAVFGITGAKEKSDKRSKHVGTDAKMA